jgi:hypothetical protein
MKVYMVATERRRRFTPKPRVAAQVLVQILLSICLCLARRTLQVLSGQDRGPDFRSVGCFSG